MGLDQGHQLGVEFVDLGGEEADAGRDRAQGEDRQSMLDARRRAAGERLGAVKLTGQGDAA